ncbi:nuclease [Agrobacterium tumefaciens]|uniref:nuclease n=1 Tax=Agrobacterium tumefaciens TaxID=358 RepID=UPI00287E4058|nr:nuclease [Agrobacterium tumefaciens]MDS7596742.1 nuclease [Agrobacterium tumefaciens]
MSNRKTTARRRKSSKSSGGSVWPWLLMFGVVVGGIRVYEHRDSLLPKRHVATASQQVKNVSRPAEEAKRDAQTTAPVKTAAIRPAAPALPGNGPIPPRPINSMPAAQAPQAAALPETRPAVEKVSLGEKSGAFAFCGQSGLNNCVADGNTFWMKGVKMHLAGVEVPQIDGARCMEERQRGFIAKVRLRDLMNAGSFEVASSGAGGARLSRSGVSFADQLVREGLAHRSGAKNQSWCGRL